MPSKTKINGTSYDLSKGRALSGGTGYDIQSFDYEKGRCVNHDLH